MCYIDLEWCTASSATLNISAPAALDYGPTREFKKFINLPIEVRYMIYEYFVICDKPVYISRRERGRNWDNDSPVSPQNFRGLFGLNWKIYEEVSRVYYGKNTFVLGNADWGSGRAPSEMAMEKFVAATLPGHLLHITNVIIQIYARSSAYFANPGTHDYPAIGSRTSAESLYAISRSIVTDIKNVISVKYEIIEQNWESDNPWDIFQPRIDPVGSVASQKHLDQSENVAAIEQMLDLLLMRGKRSKLALTKLSEVRTTSRGWIDMRAAVKTMIFAIIAIQFILTACSQSYTHDGSRQKTYDYIVVGGGLTGMVVASRLSEDKHKTVLVIERGYLDDKPQAIIPYYAYTVDESVMMRVTSAPNPKLNNATYAVAVPAVVGGGTVVNGMAYSRGSKADYDAWEELGNPGWGWDGLLPYFRKSSSFIPPSPEVARQWNMTWDLSVFGRGPLNTTIPNFQYPDAASFSGAWRQEGSIPFPRDVNDGSGPGLYWVPSTINPLDGTRVTSRKAYYDPVYQNRANLHLLTGHTVNEILIHKLHAKGVRIVSRSTNHTSNVFARKEIILAAGAVHTPHLLQISGVGPKAVLGAAGVKIKKYMPAVGANLQDHPTALMIFNITNPSFPNPNSIATNATYNSTVWTEYFANRTGPIAGSRGATGAFLSLSQLTSPSITSNITIFVSETIASPLPYLPSIYANPYLLQGYKAQARIIQNLFLTNTSIVSAFPYSGSGSAPAALQKPLSRGTITLNASNPHGPPVIQFNTLQNPIDRTILLAMIRHARRFWASPALSPLGPVELSPGVQYQVDEEILNALVNKGTLWPSLAHPCGTCAMMPEELGGCVGPDLRVYGVEGLSVVDASIIPMIPGIGLQATLYGVAEKASDLIKARA
ncbi:hypothetical protein B0O99DRAFT_739689 [Bisporella sp. PMI_857]|nr:hypothetical protein B0O99DRAFT_739689 [Bisporella sp. PMI_857]